MVRKADSPAKRMRELRHRGPKSGQKFQSFGDFFAEHCEWRRQVPDTETPDAPVDFFAAFFSPNYERPAKTVLEPSPKELWDIAARDALRLGDNDGEIRRAFEYFKLDHRNPWCWRLLVSWFCRVEFAEKRKKPPGAKPKWTADTLLKLKGEIKKRKMEDRKLWPARKVATALRNDKSSSFHGRGQEMLRQMIGVLRRA